MAKRKTTTKSKGASIVEGPKFEQSLPCRLTNTEVQGYGLTLASIVQDIADEEERQKMLKQELRATMQRLEANKSIVATKITRKEEYRNVKVFWRKNFRRGTYEIIRTDTGEVETVREMTEAEKQGELKL